MITQTKSFVLWMEDSVEAHCVRRVRIFKRHHSIVDEVPAMDVQLQVNGALQDLSPTGIKEGHAQMAIGEANRTGRGPKSSSGSRVAEAGTR
jgi:hypothetical protein